MYNAWWKFEVCLLSAVYLAVHSAVIFHSAVYSAVYSAVHLCGRALAALRL